MKHHRKIKDTELDHLLSGHIEHISQRFDERTREWIRDLSEPTPNKRPSYPIWRLICGVSGIAAAMALVFFTFPRDSVDSTGSEPSRAHSHSPQIEELFEMDASLAAGIFLLDEEFLEACLAYSN